MCSGCEVPGAGCLGPVLSQAPKPQAPSPKPSSPYVNCVRYRSGGTPSRSELLPNLFHERRRSAGHAARGARRHRGGEQGAVDAPSASGPAAVFLACHREVRANAACAAQRVELLAVCQFVGRARAVDERQGSVGPASRCSIRIDRKGAMPVPPATSSIGPRASGSAGPNRPNGPSTSSAVPACGPLEMRIERAAVLDLQEQFHGARARRLHGARTQSSRACGAASRAGRPLPPGRPRRRNGTPCRSRRMIRVRGVA